MTMQSVDKGGHGGAGGQGDRDGSFEKAIKELQGLTFSVVNGAAAGTKMDVAAIRPEDTIALAMVMPDTFAAPTSDLANITIQSVKATGTLTLSSTGPLADETFVVNGSTYTFKATADVVANGHVAIGASIGLTGDKMAERINLVERESGTPEVIASSNGAGVVTITAVDEGAGTGPVITDTGSTITISNTDPGAVTATLASVGNNDAITVNGVTFTAKTTPTDADLHVAIAASDILQAAAFVEKIEAYQSNVGDLDVEMSAPAAVITFTSKRGRKGNTVTLTESATFVAASGSGYLTGGTATGGIKSTTDLSVATLLLGWFNKTP